MTLSDLVRLTGYELVICEDPRRHPDAIGIRGSSPFAQALSGNRVAVRSDDISWCYSVSHEIADAEHLFLHSNESWSRQAEILAGWCKRLAKEAER